MRHDASSDRRGFTLLETLIALGLVSVIMSTVWSLLSMFARVERQGAERALELQLVRSIGIQLQSDLDRLAVPVDLSPMSDAAPRPPDALIGTATELQIFCRSVAEPWPTTSAADTSPGVTVEPAAGTTDGVPYQLVHYQYTPSPDLSPNAAWQVLIPGPLDDGRTTGGTLANASAVGPATSDGSRTVGAMFSSQLARPSSSGQQRMTRVGVEPRASQTDVLASDSSQPAILWAGLRRTVSRWPATSSYVAPEVAADELPELRRCRFRYFDGTRWLDSWGASSVGVAAAVDQLPTALEIQFDLDVSDTSRLGVRPSMELSGTWTPEHRWVVYLHQASRGAAEPLPTEAISP